MRRLALPTLLYLHINLHLIITIHTLWVWTHRGKHFVLYSLYKNAVNMRADERVWCWLLHFCPFYFGVIYVYVYSNGIYLLPCFVAKLCYPSHAPPVVEHTLAPWEVKGRSRSSSCLRVYFIHSRGNIGVSLACVSEAVIHQWFTIYRMQPLLTCMLPSL